MCVLHVNNTLCFKKCTPVIFKFYVLLNWKDVKKKQPCQRQLSHSLIAQSYIQLTPSQWKNENTQGTQTITEYFSNVFAPIKIITTQMLRRHNVTEARHHEKFTH